MTPAIRVHKITGPVLAKFWRDVEYRAKAVTHLRNGTYAGERNHIVLIGPTGACCAVIDPAGACRLLLGQKHRIPFWRVDNQPPPKDCVCQTFHYAPTKRPWSEQLSDKHHPFCQYTKGASEAYDRACKTSNVSMARVRELSDRLDLEAVQRAK